MSATLRRHLENRRRYGSRPKPLTHAYADPFLRNLYADDYVMSRMTLRKELAGHTGCVNALNWSRAGDKLLSGSDDMSVRVWLPQDDYRLAYAFDTGHRANIFSSKFMPDTSDAVIVTGAGDAEVRVFDVNASDSERLRHAYTCHSDRVKRISVDGPHEFLTCSEDGTVRHFDLRQPHQCTHHLVRSFITASPQPAQRYPRPPGERVRDGCPNPLVDYSNYDLDINTLTLNKVYPQYFAIAGMDDFIYLHDRRMIGTGGGGAGKNRKFSKSSRCVKRFTSGSDSRRRSGAHVTACKFSDSNGHELLGSWSADNIYLFGLHDSPFESPAQRTLRQSSAVKRTVDQSASPQSREDQMANIITLFRSDDLDKAKDELHIFEEELLSQISSSSRPRQRRTRDLRENNAIACAWTYCMLATIQMRFLQDQGEDSDEEFAGDEEASARRYMQEAGRFKPDTWRGFWCLAVGYWLASGGRQGNGRSDCHEWLEEALDNLDHAREKLIEENDETWLADTKGNFLRMMDAFEHDVREAHDMATGQHPMEVDDQEERWKYLDVMYIRESAIMGSSPRAKRARRRLQQRASLPIQEEEEGGHSSDDSDAEEDQEDDGSSADSDILNQLPFRLASEDSNSTSEDDEDDSFSDSSVSIFEVVDTTVSDDDEDEDEDDEHLFSYTSESRSMLEMDTGVVGPRTKYVGHCNIRTTKDVNFYGLHDEYVVSGSDDGFVFVWDKKTRSLVQLLYGDADTVNVIQGHPSLPVMAVSGIDDTVKIFEPIAETPKTSRLRLPKEPTSYSPSSHMFAADEIMLRNRARNRTSDNPILSRNMVAELSQAMAARAQRMGLGDTEDDDGEEYISDNCLIQ